jgi:alpha-tubulin suppressor-like RCC1 family protein
MSPQSTTKRSVLKRSILLFISLQVLLLAREPVARAQANEPSSRRRYHSVAATGFVVCELGSSGSVYCQGPAGMFGDGAKGPSNFVPIKVPGLTPQISVVADSNNVCTLGADGTVTCWDPSTPPHKIIQPTFPIQLPLSNIVDLSVSPFHACALEANGQVWCWGHNRNGELGNNSTDNTDWPVQAGISNAVSISANWGDTCAVTADGSVYCWGKNGEGELGHGTLDHIPHPRPYKIPSLTGAVSVSVGDLSSCAVLSNGTARCWGLQDEGILGNGITQPPASDIDVQRWPGALLNPDGSAGITGVRALSMGADHACASVDGPGRGWVHCWGRYDAGKFGISPEPDFPYSWSSLPVQSTLITQEPYHSWPITDLSVGFNAAARSADGHAWFWGRNLAWKAGDGGDGGMTSVLTMVPLPEGVASAPQATGSEIHTCLLRSWGVVRCTGYNAMGQLGDGTNKDKNVASTVQLTEVVGVASGAGAEHTCAVRGDGRVWCWGHNDQGQLGDNTNVTSADPVLAKGPLNGVAVAVGAAHTCELTNDGKVYCWGANSDGQLGQSTLSDNIKTPVVVPLSRPATRLVAGSYHTCALLDDGSMRCWGRNSNGQIGVGTLPWPLAAPQAVGLGGPASAIAAGGANTCALVGAQAKCWGKNDAGQVGDGTTTDRAFPTVVSGLSEVAQISAGDASCAVLGSGEVRCWGRNDNGAVGDGTLVNRLVPTAVTGISNAVHVFSTQQNTCATVADGTLWCWGQNKLGQQGNGNNQTVLGPVKAVAQF